MPKQNQTKPAVSSSAHAKSGRRWIFFGILTGGSALLAWLMMLSIAKGAADIPLATVWEALFRFRPEETSHLIVMDLRAPRAVAAALVGASLAVAGALMQGTTRNPMADSGLLGLNAGASFALSVCFAFFPQFGYLWRILFAFAGAALGAALVLGAAALRAGKTTPMRLVLAGAAVSVLFTALGQGITIYFQVAKDLMFWTVGGVAGAQWTQVRIMAPWMLGALLGAMAMSRSVSLLSLGDEVATGLGLRTRAVHALSALLVVVLAGASVSVVGSVGFVGLVVPHLARFLVGRDYRRILPSSAVLGALLMVMADACARMLHPPFETPVGVFTALIGVPFFLTLARKQRRAL